MNLTFDFQEIMNLVLVTTTDKLNATLLEITFACKGLVFLWVISS